jgi:hypothetical protein
LRLDEPAFNGERPNARENIAAVLRVRDNRLIDEHLEEEIVDVDPFARRFANDCDF